MAKEILQLESINSVDFKNEILNGISIMLQSLTSSLQNSDKDTLLTREETAKMLSISLTTLWDYTRKDIIPAYRIGSKVRYKKSDILEALQKKNKFN